MWNGGVSDSERIRILVYRPASLCHLTGYGDDKLCSQVTGSLEVFRTYLVLFKKDLEQAAAVAKINEAESSFISVFLYPAHHCHCFADV